MCPVVIVVCQKLHCVREFSNRRSGEPGYTPQQGEPGLQGPPGGPGELGQPGQQGRPGPVSVL